MVFLDAILSFDRNLLFSPGPRGVGKLQVSAHLDSFLHILHKFIFASKHSAQFDKRVGGLNRRWWLDWLAPLVGCRPVLRSSVAGASSGDLRPLLNV